MKIKFHLYILSFICFHAVQAQQLSYRSTFSNLNFVYNPALTATGDVVDAGAFYRQQWLGFEQAPMTAFAYIQHPLIYNNMSIGAFIERDEVGLLTSNAAAATYSYKLNLGKYSYHQVIIGMMVGGRQVQFNGINAIAQSYNDVYLNQGTMNGASLNVGLGLYYTTNREMHYNEDNTFFAGFGSSQILPLQYKFSDQLHYTQDIHANALVGARFIHNFLFIQPSIWVDYATNSPVHATASIIIEQIKTFWVGIDYQTDNTISLQFGYIVKLGNGRLRIGALGGFAGARNVGKQKGIGYECLISYQVEKF